LFNLRTEIVLKDANDVAFWFSLESYFATFWQDGTGKRELSQTHQTAARPKALFPKLHEYGERTNSGEVGPAEFRAAQSRDWPLLAFAARFEFEFRQRRYGGNNV